MLAPAFFSSERQSLAIVSSSGHKKATAASPLPSLVIVYPRPKGSGRFQSRSAEIKILDLLGSIRTGFRLVVGGQQDIYRRQHEQREQRADRHTRDHHETNREAAGRARAGRRQQR